MPISLDVRAALRMRRTRWDILTVQTDQLDVTPEEAAALVRETSNPFLKEVTLEPRSGAVRIRYEGATSERMKVTAARVLAPHIVR